MILAAGLTPAWQQILLFDQFQAGEVNRAREAHWCGSGKVLNVGLALHHLGGPSLTLSPLGGPALDAIEQEFDNLGVPRRWTDSSAATRICTTLLDAATGTTTELVENARSLSPDELLAFQDAYETAAATAQVVVLTGSLPAATPATFYRDLLRDTSCPAVLDVRGEELLAALDERPFLVKPNREELARTVGQSLLNDADLRGAMRQVNERGAQWVVVSQGKHAVWASSISNCYRLQPPPLAAVINPIGCGDCLAAGIAWGLRDGREVLDAIRLGMVAAGQNAEQLLPARLDLARLDPQAVRVELVA